MKKGLLSIVHSLISLIIVAMLPAVLFCCQSDPSKVLLKDIKSVLADVSDYEYGKSRSWLQKYDSLMTVVYNDPDVHEQVQKRMLKMLRSNASPEAILIVCKRLGLIANAEAIPVLTELIREPATMQMGLMALGSISDELVEEDLITMLADSEKETQLAIINLLGQRKTALAIEQLVAFLDGNDPQLKTASIEALGKIGGAESLSILAKRFEAEGLEVKWAIADAILKNVSVQGPEEWGDFALEVYNSDAPFSIRFNAFLCVIKSKVIGEKVDFIVTELTSAPPEMQQAIIPCIRELDQNADLKPIIDNFKNFPISIQMQLMLAIADRKDRHIRPLALNWLGDDNQEKRITALKALMNVSKSCDIVKLARIAANYSGLEQDLARKCLYWMDDPNTDQAVLNAISNSSGMVKAELVKCVGYRKITDGSSAVLTFLNDSDSRVRTEAIITMGKIGSESDFEVLLEWTGNRSQAEDIENTRTTLTNLALLSSNQEHTISQLDQKLHELPGEVPNCIFLEVLGGIGGDRCYSIIKPFVDHSNEKIQFTALRVLSNWENDLPLNTLKQKVQTQMTGRNHSQALAGIVYLVQYSNNLNSVKKVDELKSAFTYAATEPDKKMIIRGFSRITNKQALDFCISYIDDEFMNKEAQNAVIEIAGNLRYSEPAVAKDAVDELLQKDLEPEFEERLKILRNSISL